MAWDEFQVRMRQMSSVQGPRVGGVGGRQQVTQDVSGGSEFGDALFDVGEVLGWSRAATCSQAAFRRRE